MKKILSMLIVLIIVSSSILPNIEVEARSYRDIPVTSDEVEARPGVYWYQIDNGKFRANATEASGGIVEVTMMGTDAKPYPADQYTKTMLDMRNYPMPNTFKDAQNNVYHANDVINKEFDKVRFDPRYSGLSSLNKTFDGRQIEKVDQYRIKIATVTGVSYNNFEYKEFSKRPNGSPKMNVSYYTPLIYTWKGVVRVYDEGLEMNLSSGNACVGDTVRITPVLHKRGGTSHNVATHPNFKITTPMGGDLVSITKIGTTVNVTGKGVGTVGIYGTFEDSSQGIFEREDVTIRFVDCDDTPPPTIPEDEDVTITIYHRDRNTGEELLREQFTLSKGSSYNYVPKPEGYFSRGGANYYPSPLGQRHSGTASSSRTLVFTYALELIPPPPGEVGTPGASGGDINWRLYKPNPNGISKMKAENSMVITGEHYAIEAGSIKNTTTGRFGTKVTSGPHVVTDINADTEKGGSIKYEFEYVYTNHYKSECTGYNPEGKCSGYKQVPDWSKKVKYTDSHTLSVDHKRGEFFDLGVSGSMVNESIGWSKDTSSGVTNNQRERLTVPTEGRVKSTKTQVAIPIMENPYKYSNDFREGFHHVEKEQVDRFYWVKEVDNNLKDKYRNRTSRNYQDYAIPVEIDETRISQSGGEYTIPVVSRDDFYTTRGTGFVFSVPRGTGVGSAEATAKTEYKDFTGANYRDSLVAVSNDEKSMYYMPIDGNAEMKEKIKYTHPLVMGRMGFNDVTVKHDVDVSFQHYLVGNVFDETWVVEQHDPIVKVENYPHSIKISQEDGSRIKGIGRTDYIHSFRSTDGVDFYDTIKGILGF